MLIYIVRTIIVAAVLNSVSMFYSSDAQPQTTQSEKQEISSLFDRMKHARRTVSYQGEKKIERRIKGTLRQFNKRVFADPARNQFHEQLLLPPEQRARLQQMREHLERRIAPKFSTPQRKGIRRWNENLQRVMPFGGNIADISVRLDVLQKNYTITHRSGDTVAGRPTDTVAIEPRYEYRPGNRLWIDKETGLILKREIFNPRIPGEAVYREEFINLDILDVTGSGTPIDFVPKSGFEWQDRRMERQNPLRFQEFTSLEELSEDEQTYIGVPASLPTGFVLDKIRILRARRNVIYHQVYTDGLIAFSLFQTRGELPEQFSAENQSERSRFAGRLFSPGGTMLVKRHDDMNYIIVGYVPKELLQPILDTLPTK